jgi:DNA replication protein DnaC
MDGNFKPLGDSLARDLGAKFSKTRMVPRGVKCDDCGAELEEQHVPGLSRVIPVPCICVRNRVTEAEEIRRLNQAEAETLERLRTQGAARRERLKSLDLMPDMMSKKWTFETYEVEPGNALAFVMAENFVNQTLRDRTTYEVPGFGLYGDHGVGKSHLTTGLAKILIEKGIDVVQIYEYDIRSVLNRIRNGEISFSEDVFAQDLISVPVLIIEDFMKSRVKNASGANLEYVHEFLFRVVQKRIMKSLPIIVTSNHSYEDLRDVYLKGLEFGPAILDRFAESFGCDERRWLRITAEKSHRLHGAK